MIVLNQPELDASKQSSGPMVIPGKNRAERRDIFAAHLAKENVARFDLTKMSWMLN
jgi:hypothetical protein